MAIHVGILKKSPELILSDVPVAKIGGDPLYFEESPADLACCELPPRFLLQILAPGPSEESFYRYLYVFQCCVCKSPLVLRAQLPETNSILQEPVEDDWNDEVDDEEILGMMNNSAKLTDFTLEILEEHPRFKHTIEMLFNINVKNDVQVQDLYDSMHPDRGETEEEMNDDSDSDDDLKDLEKAQRENEDVSFNTMRWYRDSEPQACIRYGLNQAPLWYSDQHRPRLEPPHCSCGAQRVFEFQVLPRTMSCFNDLDVEFGTILVYTCKESCSYDGKFKTEIGFLQPIL